MDSRAKNRKLGSLSWAWEFRMLKKVVVFDSGFAGGVISEMVEQELPVTVIRAHDREHAPYAERSEAEIREMTEKALSGFIGRVDLIVLAEPEVALSAGEFLKRKYPEQKFVGYGRELTRVLRRGRAFGEVRVLTNRAVRRTTRYQEMKAACADVKVSESVTLDKFSAGTVVIYATNLLRQKAELKRRTPWQVSVIDMRDSLLRDACRALELPGVDGKMRRELEG